MERIKLGSGKELNLIVCGIMADAQTVTMKFVPGNDSLDTLNTLLMDTAQTEKMTLLSTGRAGYIQRIYAATVDWAGTGCCDRLHAG